MSKFRRRPDGKPEVRSLDDLLAQAAQDDVVQKLPGKGRPLDLHGYRHADAETRIANKLLQDHHVIPQPLQDRRDAELLEQRAESDATAALADLAARRQAIEALQIRLCTQWPAVVADLAGLFEPEAVPSWLLTDTRSTDHGDWSATAADLAQAAAAHNQQRAVYRRSVETVLNKAADVARRLNQQISLSRTMPPGLQMTPVRAAARLEQFDVDCPVVAHIPADLSDRLCQAVRAATPTWWRRLLGV